MSDSSIKYLSRKVDNLKEKIVGINTRVGNRIDRLRRRLQRSEEKLIQVEDFLLLGPHASAYKIYLENLKNSKEV